VPTPTEPAWLRLLGRTLALAIVVSSVAAAWWTWEIGYREPRTDDAAVRANLVGIAPHVSGPIVELNVVDNQQVHQGDLLFVVDPRPYEVELESARAAQLLTESELAAISSAVQAAAADVARLEAEDAFYSDHVKRLHNLLAGKFVTLDAYQEAQVKAQASMASLTRARQELERQRSLLAQFGDVNARRAAAEATVRGAELNLQYCRVSAPFDARITNLNIAQGEYARAAQQVFALVDTRAWYVLANFQETYLDSIRPGMAAEVYLMSYPNQRFRGVVQGIGWAVLPADSHTVGVLPDVKATLNWVRLAQRIPVRVLLEPPDAARPYRMGMTAVVTIRGDQPLIATVSEVQ
jgi:membrane fusion protein, multidrug efflux system